MKQQCKYRIFQERKSFGDFLAPSQTRSPRKLQGSNAVEWHWQYLPARHRHVNERYQGRQNKYCICLCWLPFLWDERKSTWKYMHRIFLQVKNRSLNSLWNSCIKLTQLTNSLGYIQDLLFFFFLIRSCKPQEYGRLGSLDGFGFKGRELK